MCKHRPVVYDQTRVGGVTVIMMPSRSASPLLEGGSQADSNTDMFIQRCHSYIYIYLSQFKVQDSQDE